MGLESATYVNQLNQNNPRNSDKRLRGDDHIRLIKEVLQNSFPNLGAEAVNATVAELNSIFNQNRFFNSKMICEYFGDVNDIPSGWFICDGTNGTPDLKDRFIIGAGNTYEVGQIGGNRDLVFNETGETILGVSDIPAHNHSEPIGAEYRNGTGDTVGSYISLTENDTKFFFSNETSLTGGGQPHKHSIPIAEDANLPEYYSLVYIMKG